MEAKKAWVDFNLIKAAVTMEMLIVQYGITTLERNGQEMRGVCPIHQGKSKREFSINLVKNTFCCFAPRCKARGNVLDFVAQIEHCSVKEAALKLDEWFGVTKQEIGESATTESPAAQAGESIASLISEIEAHITNSLQQNSLATEKLARLRQLISAR